MNLDTENKQRVRTICRSCGHGGCGVYVVVEDGKVVKIQPDKEHPVSKGYTCKKAYGSIELQYHPDRLLYPMRRAGARGEGKWERLSWDEALTEVAGKLNQFKQESGAESVVFGHGTGRDFHRFVYRVANLFGTPNVLTPGHMCYLPRVAISKLMGMDISLCDYDSKPACVVAWGSNHLISNPDENKGINLAKTLTNGAKFIVIDPRRTKLADKADLFLQIRPATDSALALAMMHVIVKEDLYDHHFVENYTTGFEKFVERLEEYPPERAEKITWVPKEKIIEAARLYATTKPAAMQWGVGIEQNINCVDADRALIYLVALTGNLDVPGGNVIFGLPPGLPRAKFSLFDQLPPEQHAKMLGGDRYRLGATINRITPHVVWDAIEEADPYQVRAMVIFASNTLTARENARRVHDVLKNKLEYFVAVDIFPTLTTELADIVLPAATWLENDNIADYWKVHGYVFPRNKAVEPEGQARPDHLILNELGQKLGFTEHFWEDYEESLDFILEPAGLTWDEFREMPYLQTDVKYRKYEKDGFNSASGKLDFYLHKYEEWGYDPLPGFVEPPESPAREPEFVEKYPLVLITGQRIFNFFGSEHRQGDYLRRTHPDPMVEIHPDTAAARGISDGDWVHISSPRDQVRFRARIFDGIDPRVVSAEWGWWFPEKDRTDIEVQLESNINLLTEDAGGLDPGMGATNLKGLMCQVEKAAA
ncbi:MAG: molybdopterin-dependent oxidoreductase [Gammaproteobacteria bacterium]|nr:molybdopterin-dependent oxidoreductase [Gammaproteobacteria bacterium]